MTQTLETPRPPAGFRVADPIQRKQRTPASRTQPRPKFANSVEWSFKNGQPLESEVPTRAVGDTVRALKTAARFLDRTTDHEVRVQISVEPVMVQDTNDAGEPLFDNGKPVMVPAKPARSVVKFLGHEPWVLGRRVAMVKSQGEGDATPAEPAPSGAKHRRTTASTRAKHVALCDSPLVGAIITLD